MVRPEISARSSSASTSTGTVAVVGLGYIGLPTAVSLATGGLDVVGVDISPGIVELVNRGEAPFAEPDLSVGVSGAVAMGRLTAQCEMPHADAYIIAVPTPFEDGHRPDLRAVTAAARSIAPVLRGGEVIVLESTVPPGTTRAISELIAAFRPDLSFPHASEEPDVHLAHCPERVLPGRIMIEIATNDRVIGGLTPACAARAAELYRTFCHGELIITDAASAEMAKLAENAYRDVNIAFANELSIIADKLRHPPTPDFRVVLLLPAKANNGAEDTQGQLSVLIEADDDHGRLLGATVRSLSPMKDRADPLYVHAKVAVIDDRWLIIGSANLNAHSFFNDTEMCVVTDDAALARSTRVRLWAEHLELTEDDVEAQPVVRLVDERWRPIASEQLERMRSGRNPTHRLLELPGVSRRSKRLLGPLTGLVDDG